MNGRAAGKVESAQRFEPTIQTPSPVGDLNSNKRDVIKESTARASYNFQIRVLKVYKVVDKSAPENKEDEKRFDCGAFGRRAKRNVGRDHCKHAEINLNRHQCIYFFIHDEEKKEEFFPNLLLIDHEHIGRQVGNQFVWLGAHASQQHVIKVANEFGARFREDK